MPISTKNGRGAAAMRRTRRGSQPLGRSAAAAKAPSVVRHSGSLRLKATKFVASFWGPQVQPPTTRIVMVEVAEAVQGKSVGNIAWLSDFVCFRLFPITHPHVFRKHVHVVPRSERHDLADYVIGVRLFHEEENTL